MWTRLVPLLCTTWASTVSLCIAQPGAAAPNVAQATINDTTARIAIGNAHRLQSDFERRRRGALPVLQPSTDQPCEERVGRLCYWHRESDTAVTEPVTITRDRDRLIDRLGRLVRLVPTDPWTVGQHIHYLVEGGYDSSAIRAAHQCASTPWWCMALRGYVLHDLQRYTDAEAAFDSALLAMPTTDRCAWNDISLLLPDNERQQYAATPCEQRTETERRFWQLADPSYVIPGNDRRTEHFFRMVSITLARDGQNVYGLSWGDDLRELILRYGEPIAYNTAWISSGTMSDRPVIGHDREPSYHFAALATSTDSAHWELRATRARERYAPRYLTRIDDFSAQFAMFKRGDSALIVAIYPAAHTAQAAEPLLGITDKFGVTIAPDSNDGPRVRRTRVAWHGVVAGVERYDSSTRRLERSRIWLAPPASSHDTPALSTLLLYTPAPDDTTGVTCLDDAIHHALTTTDLGAARQIGLYWEMYGLTRDTTTDSTAADSATTLAITVLRTDGGVWRWLANTLRLSPGESPLNIGWHDLPGTPGGIAKAVVLDLSQLSAGAYRIELSAGRDPAHRTVTSRDIRLR